MKNHEAIIREKSDRKRFKSIKKWIKEGDILDMGSNRGNLNYLLIGDESLQSSHIYTLDITRNCDFQIDLDNPKPLNKQFDTLIAGEIIEHLKSPIGFIEYCKTLLKNSGRLILTTPNAIGLQYIKNPNWFVSNFEANLGGAEFRGHTQCFTLSMLKRICKDAGLKILYAGYINAFWNRNPLQIIPIIFPRIKTDLIVVCVK